MPESCHSLVSRYAAIASAARNERERPVLLASFRAGFWSSDLREQKTCLCSYVYSISQRTICEVITSSNSKCNDVTFAAYEGIQPFNSREA
jgi:hypothetical protein